MSSPQQLPPTEQWYISLLGMAENFRTSNPPNIRFCIHCLQAIFTFKPAPRIEARTHLQLGHILFTHTKNADLARQHLEKAWAIAHKTAMMDEVRFESASLLAQIYEKDKDGKQMDNVKAILRKGVETSQQAPYWHCRLLLQLAQIHTLERDYVSACDLLGVGAEFANVKRAEHTRILFLLGKGMLLLIEKKLNDVHQVLSLAGQLIEQMTNYPSWKESLKVYFLILQVCHFLMAGQVKSVKPSLKQLQQSIQSITAQTEEPEPVTAIPADLFQWLPKEQMCVLVYLVTVMHSMQAGYMEKAEKYTDKALMQIEKLKMLDSSPLLNTFQLILLEHIIMCRLIMGNKTSAIQEICQACQLCQMHPVLFQTHGAQLHTLLGLYAMSMNCMDAAEAQFNAAIQRTREPDLWTFINLNLAIVYLRLGRQNDLLTLMDRIDPERLHTNSYTLKASAFYVRGLKSFFHARYNEAKRYLRETLKMANAEDLNRLTSCSLVLLGHIFLSLGNSSEAMNMVTPSMQLASKIPDLHIQLWASALLKDLYALLGDGARASDGVRMHETFTQALLKDHFQASQQSEHNLIQWTTGACPTHLASNSASVL